MYDAPLDQWLGALTNFGTKRPLIILGNQFFKSAGFLDKLTAALQASQITPTVFDDFRRADVETAKRARDLAIDQGVDSIITIGGGTAHDLGKTVALLTANSNAKLMPILQGQQSVTGWSYLPVFTIPTMPGSGSEANGSAQLNGTDGLPYGLEGIYPALTYLQPDYLSTLPTASLIQGSLTILSQLTLMDLTADSNHLIEGTLDQYLTTLVKTLRSVVDHQQASHDELGTILQLSSLAIGSHIQYGKTMDWGILLLTMQVMNRWQVSYSQAISLLLPGWVAVVGTATPAFDHYCQTMGIDPTNVVTGLQDVYRRLKMPTRLSEVGQTPAQPLTAWAEEMAASTLQGVMSAEQIQKILNLTE